MDAESQRYVDKVLQDFERNGLNLDQIKRKYIATLMSQIADLEREASTNINNDNTKVEFHVDDLDGLPSILIEKLESVEGKEGYKYVSMKYPEVLPALKLCKNEETRRELNFAHGTRCIEENTPILEDLVAKRHQLAEILGYSSYSEYILEVRMAKTPLNV